MAKYIYVLVILLLGSNGLTAQNTDSIFGDRQVLQSIKIDDLKTAYSSLSGLTDIDLDGLQDFYLKMGEKIYWAKNLGDGEFAEIDYLTTVYKGTTDIKFTDLDNDGDVDLLYTTKREFKTGSSRFNEQAVYYRENRNDIFKASIQITEVKGGSRKQAYFMDIDGDGDMDIVTYHHYSANKKGIQNDFRLIENLENLNFSDENILIDEISKYNLIKFVDVNNDGLLDITGQFEEEGFGYYLNEGNNEYSGFNFIKPDIPIYYSFDYLFEDIDQDGINDLIATNYVQTHVEGHYYRKENGVDYFKLESGVYNKKNLFRLDRHYIVGAIFIDIDLDSHKDLFFKAGDMEGDVSDLWWSKNSSAFNFSKPEKTKIKLDPYQRIVGFLDINSNGYQDVFTEYISGEDSYVIAWYENEVAQKVDVERPTESLPKTSKLFQNYPNPFNPTTNFVFSLKSSGQVEFRIFDYLGRNVANISPKIYTNGTHEVRFDASALSSGIYFYQMIGNEFIENGKFTVLK